MMYRLFGIGYFELFSHETVPEKLRPLYDANSKFKTTKKCDKKVTPFKTGRRSLKLISKRSK